MVNDNQDTALFQEATKLLQENLLIDAIGKFQQLADDYPESDLADDALLNVGLCYFHISLFNIAINTFNNVIIKYPDGNIYTTDGTEFGKTAAKCHYSLINCYLGLADFEAAKNEMDKLRNYPEAYIITPIGQKIAFVELGEKALQAYLKLAV